MESEINNATIDLKTPMKAKVNRRSSIFRADSTDINYKNKNSVEYLDKLKQEIVDWKNYYAQIKEEYKELRVYNKEPHSGEVVPDLQCQDFQKKVEDFCNNANKVKAMHQHLLLCKNIRMQEIQNLIKAADFKIQEKLNLS